MQKISVNPKNFYQGCLLAALAHAVTVGEYPELNYEHSWDGINYCLNNSGGCRATITFSERHIIAAFRNERQVKNNQEDALSFFEGAPKDLLALAKTETLQYFLDDVDGQTKPLITAAFWGNWQELWSNQSLEQLFKQGVYILENQLLPYQEALDCWVEDYQCHHGQLTLIEQLFRQKLAIECSEKIVLSEDDHQHLYGDLDQCRESLAELNITFDHH